MSADLIPFSYEGLQVRTVQIDDEPWFVAADVCAALTLRDTTSALRMVDSEDKEYFRRSDTPLFPRGIPPQVQEIALVNESGLYALIFQSNKPKAKEFKRWVTHEVLPAIRETGSYSKRELTRVEILEMALDSERRAITAEAAVAELKPAANAWTTLASADGDLSVAQAAKILSRDPNINLGRDRLFAVLRECRWVYRQHGNGRHEPYQSAVDAGRLSELPSHRTNKKTGVEALNVPTVRVTVKGLLELHKRLGGVAPLQLQFPLFGIDGGAA